MVTYFVDMDVANFIMCHHSYCVDLVWSRDVTNNQSEKKEILVEKSIYNKTL